MNAPLRSTFALVSVAVLMVCVASPAGAQGRTTTRPIQDFVDTQASSVFPPGLQINWFDPDSNRGLTVDYAGVLNADSDLGLGTSFSGTVTERRLADGRTRVHVVLHTRDALAYVIDYNVFAVVLGATAEGVQSGATPALAESHLKFDFIHDVPPGGPLPSLVDALFLGVPGVEVLSIGFNAYAEGPLHALDGVPDGAPGAAQTTQRQLSTPPGLDNNHPGRYPVEHVHLMTRLP